MSLNESVTTRIKRLLGGSFIVYAVLVATHLGEFWPFSIYPMFSRGGYPWVRSVVRDVTPTDTTAVPLELTDDPEFWTGTDRDGLMGEAYPLVPAGINQNDIANFVSKSTEWSTRRIDGMRKVYGDALSTTTLLVYRVDGRLGDDGAIGVTYTPYILMTPDTTVINPVALGAEGAR